MLETLRRQCRLITYYSAMRKKTVWSRVINWASIVALVAALPITITAETIVVQPVSKRSEVGMLGRTDGAITATWHGDGKEDHPARPYGEWALTQSETRRGWPFPSVRRLETPRLELNLFDESGRKYNVQISTADPQRVAIEAILDAGGQDDLVAAWRGHVAQGEMRSWLGSIANAMIWWIGLSCASLVAVRLLSLVVKLTRVRRQGILSARGATGHCPSCNYDMRGLEWAERCPECGTLAK